MKIPGTLKTDDGKPMYNIIVADDDPAGRALISKLLIKQNCRPVIAANGVEAWNHLIETKARIVLTDWMMPEMNGLELCRKIRDAEFSEYIYIIVVTANERKQDAIEGFKAGADDYITKPIFPEELLARIRSGQRIIDLEDRNKKVAMQLFQADKMASVGQLAAGVAHEINNPTGFVNSNLKTLSGYIEDISRLMERYSDLVKQIEERDGLDKHAPELLQAAEAIRGLERDYDIEYLSEDIADIIKDSMEGTERIKKIVADMKEFAHPGQDTMKMVDINDGLESTLNVIRNEIKYKADVVTDYGELPPVLCYPQQLNQVFMNILVNAAQAIEERGEIHISTSFSGTSVEIRIRDNGCGISKENLTRIFDPFFTTKEVGKGTGLGMNVAYNIVQKHNGTIDVESEPEKGTQFTVRIPVKQEDE